MLIILKVSQIDVLGLGSTSNLVDIHGWFHFYGVKEVRIHNLMLSCFETFGQEQSVQMSMLCLVFQTFRTVINGKESCHVSQKCLWTLNQIIFFIHAVVQKDGNLLEQYKCCLWLYLVWCVVHVFAMTISKPLYYLNLLMILNYLIIFSFCQYFIWVD